MSGTQLFMKEDLKITDTRIEILASVISIYSLFGSLAAGMTSDWLGRRYTMVLAAAIFLTGAIIMGLAPNYAFLMAGRIMAGIGVGYAFMIAPVYTAEVAPTSIRGFLSTFPEVFNNFGILLGYVSNFAFARLPIHQSWRAMFLISAVPPVFLGFVVLAMPESPRWLVMRGRIKDARHVLRSGSSTSRESSASPRTAPTPTMWSPSCAPTRPRAGRGCGRRCSSTRAGPCGACSWPASASCSSSRPQASTGS
jgi:MFS family permease